MLGTAFPAARLLLVEQPLPWGPEGLRTSRFDSATALAVEARARAEGIRVQAIRPPGRAHRVHRRWALVDTRDESRTLRWGTFDDDAELLELPLDGSTGEPDPGPLYLVCTHGKHDPCCALRGRPVTVALEALRPGRVWQASHLGGCRFAPTVLVLPLGVMYGRVPPSATPELVAAAETDEVIGTLLRGRIGMPPAAQAAIAFAHQRLELPRCPRRLAGVDDDARRRDRAGARRQPARSARRHRDPGTRRRDRAHLRLARAELVRRAPSRGDRAGGDPLGTKAAWREAAAV